RSDQLCDPPARLGQRAQAGQDRWDRCGGDAGGAGSVRCRSTSGPVRGARAHGERRTTARSEPAARSTGAPEEAPGATRPGRGAAIRVSVAGPLVWPAQLAALAATVARMVAGPAPTDARERRVARASGARLDQ